MSHPVNTRRVLAHVESIRSQPNGRSKTMSRRVLELLQTFLKAHPHAKEVREAIGMIEEELAAGARARRMSFGEFAAQWVSARRAEGANVALMGAYVRQRLAPALGEKELGALTSADVKRWVESRRGSRSFERERELLRSILLAAVVEGRLRGVPGEEHLR